MKAILIDKAKEWLDENCENPYTRAAICGILGSMPSIELNDEWIKVEDEMPPEHDSMFKNFKGTKKWIDGMFETISDTVIVSVKFEDGTRKTFPAHTADGKWHGLPIIGNCEVTHWMPMPGPPKIDRR